MRHLFRAFSAGSPAQNFDPDQGAIPDKTTSGTKTVISGNSRQINGQKKGRRDQESIGGVLPWRPENQSVVTEFN